MNMIIYAKNKNKIPIIIQNIFNNNLIIKMYVINGDE